MTAPALPVLPRQSPGIHISPGVGETVTYAVVDAAGSVMLSGHVRAELCDEEFLAGLRRFYRRQRPHLALV